MTRSTSLPATRSGLARTAATASFPALAEDNKLAVQSLAELERELRARGLHPYFITGHTGWTDNFAFAFAHKDKRCSPFKKRVHDPSAPYDAYDESDDTEENAKSGFLKGVGR